MAMNKGNFGETTLGAAIANDSDTAITVTSGDSFPSAPFLITIGTEILKCTDKGAGTNWTVTRGEQSSVAVAHANGTVVQHNITAGDFTSLVEGPASATDNAIVRFDTTTGKLLQDYTSNAPTISDTGDLTLGTTARVQSNITATDTATLGDEQCLNGTFATNDFTSWTAGANWSAGTGVAVATAPAGTLAQTIALTTGKTYQVSFTMTLTAGYLTVTFPAMEGSYNFFGSATVYRTFACASTTDYALTFTPSTLFAGSVDTVSVKEVSGTNDAVLKVFDLGGTDAMELRSGDGGNMFLGYRSGYVRTSGLNNAGAGYAALMKLTTGNNNVGLGNASLTNLTTGSGNLALGTSSLYALRIGENNAGIGISALYALTTGSDDVGIGYASCYTMTTGSQNVGIGTSAGRSVTTGGTNTFIGYAAGYNASQKNDAANSTAIGNGAYTTASNQMIFGNASVTAFGFKTFTPAGGMCLNSGLHVGGDSDAGNNNLLVDGTGTITGAFGCNSKTAQTAYASGGALAAYGAGANGLDSGANMSALHALVVKIRAALVANGIMS